MASEDTPRNALRLCVCVSLLLLVTRLKLFRGQDNVEPYQGARDLQSLLQFVMEKVAGVEKTASEGEGEEVKREAGEEGVEAVEVVKDEHGMLHLTDDTFNSLINSKEGILFVKFYAPW